jgi:hypothetical protein
MDIQEISCKGVECIQLALDREKGPAVLKMVINFWVTKDSTPWSQFVKIYFIYAPPPQKKTKSIEEVKERRMYSYNICLLNVKSILLLLSQRDNR